MGPIVIFPLNSVLGRGRPCISFRKVSWGNLRPEEVNKDVKSFAFNWVHSEIPGKERFLAKAPVQKSSLPPPSIPLQDTLRASWFSCF